MIVPLFAVVGTYKTKYLLRRYDLIIVIDLLKLDIN